MNVWSPSRRRRPWTLYALGRSPLVRGSDRMEAFLLVLFLFVMAVPAPIAALSAGHDIYAHRVAEIDQARAGLRQVEAIADTDSVASVTRLGSVRTVEARWREAFTERSTKVRVDRDVTAGERIPVWLDHEGKVAAAPLTASAARLDGIAVAIAMWLGLAVACAAANGVARSALDSRRSRAWGREWALFINNDDGWANRGRFR